MFEKIALGRTDLVFEFVAQGGDATQTDAQGTSLLRLCAYHGDVSAIRFLLERGESLDALGDNFDLNGAVFHGHWQLVQFLLEHGADVHRALPDTGETALHAALCKANRPVYKDIVEILLSRGADSNAKTHPGVPTGGFMRDCRTRGETPLHRAAAFADEATIDLLLGAKADVEVRDSNGDTPLAWASWHLRPPAVLRRLCYGKHTIHPDNDATYDHGTGWGQLDMGRHSRPVF